MKDTNIRLFDTHNHYNSKEFDNDLQTLLLNHKLNNDFINIVGTNLQDNITAIEIAKKFNNCFATIGIHPENHIQDLTNAINELETLYLNNKQYVIAIGECGLDYFYDDNPSKMQQKALFIKQIELAIKYHLPLILHIRKAHDDCIEILKKYYQQLESVIIHCFSDDIKYMKEYIKMNCFISFSGMITFKKNDELRNCVKALDINYLLTETDCPFLSPEPYRGKRNDSNNLIYTNQLIANIKNINFEQFIKIINNNAIKALKLKHYL